MTLLQAKLDATETRLAAVRVPAGAAWAETARANALARVRSMGLPSRRDEYWKHTRPDTLVLPGAPEAALFVDDEIPPFDDVDRLRLVFVDGVLDADASDPLEGAGLTVERLAEATRSDIHWAKTLYGALETRGQLPIERPLAALNTAIADDGVVIRATAEVKKPVSLIYRRRRTTSDAVLHHLVKVDQGAELTILETGSVAARCNMVLEVDIADGGTFHHLRVQGNDHQRQAMAHTFARLGQESVFKSFTLTVDGLLTRNECVIELTGDNAAAHVSGAAMGDGRFHHDDTVFVVHDAVGCESRQVFKKVLRDGAVGVFQGKILVKEEAQKTDGYQISQSLLLDDDSQFLAKPELEIYADDVACSHGSTTGAIDEAALFYLRARGIEKADAHDLLILSFLAEAIEEIDDRALAGQITGRLTNWLKQRRG